MTEFEESGGGLMVPKRKEAPRRGWVVIEIIWSVDREEAHKCLTRLLNLAGNRYAGTAEARKARQDLLLFVAHQLLGDDFEYEELC